MKFDIVFSNKPSALNKKLVKFFQVNLQNLNKTLITFNFEVAHPDEMSKYVARGVKNYPILILDNKSVTGVEKIITYLKTLVDNHNKKILNKTDDDYVSDFWKDTIDTGDENDDTAGDNVHKKIQDAFEQRNETTEQSPTKSAQPQNNTSSHDETPSETLKKMKGNSMDDELMAKFFENQGID
jgi:hypothetical protein